MEFQLGKDRLFFRFESASPDSGKGQRRRRFGEATSIFAFCDGKYFGPIFFFLSHTKSFSSAGAVL